MKVDKAAHTLYKTKISYRLDNPVPKYDFSNRSKELSENKASGNKKILSCLGIYRDRDKE